ncbi:serine hydrolase [Bifidobacterium eulemuris]|nr:serine hydrolase [Bifidobacterium eulemuris]
MPTPRSYTEMQRMYRRRRVVVVMVIVAVAACVTGLGVMIHSQLVGDEAQAAADDVSSSAEVSSASDEDDEAEAQAQAEAEALAAAQAEAAAISAEVEIQLDEVFAGAEYAVEVVDLENGTTPVAIDEDEVFVSASTYKLYVAYSMLSAVDSGTMTWESELNGTTLGECFAQMIEISDNACPEAWLYDVSSRDEVTAQAHSIGATSTAFVDGQAATTTASDLATILTGVYEGTLLSQSSKETLIDEMMAQVYRYGIPAGIGDSGVVADKVGFLDGYLNDAGIVYSDKGDYVFVILTNNSSWEAIAQATSIIYDALPEA